MMRSILSFFIACFLPIFLFALPTAPKVVEGEAFITSYDQELMIEVENNAHIEWDTFDLGEDEVVTIFQSNESQGLHLSIKGNHLAKILGKVQSNGPLYLKHEGGVTIGIEGEIVASLVEIDAETISHQGKVTVPGNHMTLSGKTVYVYPEGVLDASANDKGDGGTISILGQEAMIFLGTARSSGGELSGDGGKLKLCSSKDFKYKDGSIDLTAPHGKAGLLHIDPKNVYIRAGGPDSATGNTFGSDPTGTAMISGPDLSVALDNANVLIQANNDIIIDDNVTGTTSGNCLTLQAGRSIIVDPQSVITLTAGDFSATINDNGAQAVNRDPGSAIFELAFGSQILTNGGEVTVDVGDFGGQNEGTFYCNGATIDAGNGNISLTGYGPLDGSDMAYGTVITGGSLIQTSGSGEITLAGTGGNGDNLNNGIQISGSGAQIITDAGMINLDGQGGGTSSGKNNKGLSLQGTVKTTTGSVLISGVGGLGISNNVGVEITSGIAPNIETEDGSVQVIGTGGGTGDLNFGVRLGSSALVTSTGQGTLSISGTAGDGDTNNHGVILAGGTVQSNEGAITITGNGQGKGDYNYGVRFESGGKVNSLVNAPITIEGACSPGGREGNCGISVSGLSSTIQAVDGSVTLTGTGNGTDAFNQGVRIENSQIVSKGTGSEAATLNLIGFGGTGTNYNNGISISGHLAEVTAIDGDIDVEGTAKGTGIGNTGVSLSSSDVVNTTGDGVVTIDSH
ncbi:beta strand repeat-containing protein [Candidatus Neptunochlamydia vexilliferae]|nr:hypothetical protein [Candidatus Neptunochlamydia vexilliferae]